MDYARKHGSMMRGSVLLTSYWLRLLVRILSVGGGSWISVRADIGISSFGMFSGAGSTFDTGIDI